MSKLALPPLSGIDPKVQSALRSIQSWANTVDSAQILAQQTNARNKTVAVSRTRYITADEAKNISDGAVRDFAVRRGVEIFRSVLSNSGNEPLVNMNAPVLFRATNTVDSTDYKLYIGAGGVAGGYIATGGADADTTMTFSLASADGSFFFGAEDPANTSDPAHRQIVFDAQNNVIVFGASIKIRRSNGETILLEDVASGAAAGAAAIAALDDKLDKGMTYILGSDIAFKTSGYDGGNGLAITNNGILAKKSGSPTVAIDNNGNASFKGDISGSTGSFVGTLSTSSYVYASGAVSVSGVGFGCVVGRPAGFGNGLIGVTDGGGAGVVGIATTVPGIGVLAQGTGSGVALSVQGRLSFGAYTYAQPNGSSSQFLCANGTWATPSSGVVGDASSLGGYSATEYLRQSSSPGSYVGDAWGISWYRKGVYINGSLYYVLMSY